jgi:hypothetical protein
MGFFEWWADLPAWLRYGVALVFLVISTGLMIVRVISPLGGPDAIEFLGTALDDPHAEVWKAALDGLVSNASPSSRRAIEQAKGRIATHGRERLAWFVEAIEQINETTFADGPCMSAILVVVRLGW